MILRALNPMWHYGQSFSNNELVYPKIPKSASSWGKQYLLDLGWTLTNFSTDNLTELPALVFLRDPRDRWISGVGEYLTRLYNFLPQAKASVNFRNVVLASIFNTMCLDEHTALQTFFIRGLSNPIYFKVNENLADAVASYLQTTVNQTMVNSKVNGMEWREFIEEYLLDKKEVTEKLDSYLKPDYDIFKSVRFQ